ncbi:glycosyltransferase family 39 protein [Cerasicoccus maritimus]|uniref:glycosyltransferase family 39 protein n=1 Tax=Cerasicoccus maritimus TaxID=490089 RepID=UPI00285255B3|nr:glycosyltransferase family 39 protein [Cerasicoccus maritimus]
MGTVLQRKLAIFVITVGALLRLRQLLAIRSLWCDETMLAMNLYAKSFQELMFSPLDFDQLAPVGYLVLGKLSVILFGPNELGFRMPAFIFGVCSLPLAYLLGRSAFKSAWSALCFTSLIALSPILVYYSNEVKPYELDAFFALLNLYAYQCYCADKLRPWALWAIGAASLLFSFPACFVLAAIGALEFLRNIRQGKRQPAIHAAVISSCWLITFAAIYAVFIRGSHNSDYMQDYWQSGFMPHAPGQAIPWLGESLLGLSHLSLFQDRPNGLKSSLDWFNWSNLTALTLIAIGLACGFRSKQRPLVAIALAAAIMIGASAVELYPFRNRMLLGLTPLVYLALTSGLDYCLCAPRKTLRWVGIAYSSALLGLLALSAAWTAIRPTQHQDIKAVMAYIQAHAEPGDQIAVSRWSYLTYFYYSPVYELSNPPDIKVRSYPEAKQFMAEQAPSGRIWFLFSVRPGQGARFIDELTSKDAQQLARQDAQGASCFLLEFSPSASHAANRPPSPAIPNL